MNQPSLDLRESDETDRHGDWATLRDPRMARSGIVAGILSIVLAPIVIGFAPAAVGLHSAITHLRFRAGSRPLAWTGLALSVFGALGSIGAALLWGTVLMTVLLQRSAVHQAQSWEGSTPPAWSLVDLDGTTHASVDLTGRVVFLDCFSPTSPYCANTTRCLAEFAAKHADITALSWSADAPAEEAKEFAARCGRTSPLCVGLQSMPPPFSDVAAKPTLFVIDASGTVRNVVLGRYDEKDLANLLDAARSPRVPAAAAARAKRDADAERR